MTEYYRDRVQFGGPTNPKRRHPVLWTLVAAAVLVLVALFTPATAHATETPACGMPTGWYANADEQDRLPTVVAGGLEFSGNDLIHHATTGTVEQLAHGTFTADPAPDQPSFFSVEVVNSDGTGYATLRWNTATSVWDMVTGGQLYSNADPAALVEMPPSKKSHHVVSFGVGYTANPPGTVTTVVSAVGFGGKAYDLTCKPKPSESSSSPASSHPAPSGSTSAANPGHVSTHPNPPSSGAQGALAITGSSTWPLIGGGVLLFALGIGAVFLAQRRRRTRFIP